MVHCSSHVFQSSHGLLFIRTSEGSLKSSIPIQTLRPAFGTFVKFVLLHLWLKESHLPKETEEELVICEASHEKL